MTPSERRTSRARVIRDLLVAVFTKISARLAHAAQRRSRPRPHPFRDAAPGALTEMDFWFPPTPRDDEAWRAFGLDPKKPE